MENHNNKKIIFDVPGDADMVDIIDEILKNNGIEETLDEFEGALENNEESKLIIVRDTAKVILQKKIPEKKLIELLAEHLEIPQETAEKIIQEIKEKLIPYAKIIDLEKEEEQRKKEKEVEYQKEKIQEELLNKIRGNAPIRESDMEAELPIISVKKIDIVDVEKNAERIKSERKPISSTLKENKIPQSAPSENKKDPYKEPVE